MESGPAFDQRGTPDIIRPKKDGAAMGVEYSDGKDDSAPKPATCPAGGGYLLGFGHMNKSCLDCIKLHPSHPTTLYILEHGVPHSRRWHEDISKAVAENIRMRANSFHDLGAATSWLEVTI